MSDYPSRKFDARTRMVAEEDQKPQPEDDDPIYDNDGEHERKVIEPEDGECLVI